MAESHLLMVVLVVLQTFTSQIRWVYKVGYAGNAIGIFVKDASKQLIILIKCNKKGQKCLRVRKI